MIGTERRAGAQAAISCFSASSISDISPGSNRNSAAPDDSRNLLHTPEADNRACHRWVVQRPGNGHFSRRGLVAIPDIAKALYQSQIPRQQRLLEIREVSAPVVCGKVRNSLVRHGPGEQSGGHWRIHNDADVVPQREGQDFFFDRTARLQTEGKVRYNGVSNQCFPKCGGRRALLRLRLCSLPIQLSLSSVHPSSMSSSGSGQ
jgi:hypothetical protein